MIIFDFTGRLHISIFMLMIYSGLAFAYETGEFEAPVDIGNGNYLFEGSVFHFEKEHNNFDANYDGKVDTNLTQYKNLDGQHLVKKVVTNSDSHNDKIWEWYFMDNYYDPLSEKNYNLTDLNGDGTFDIKSQYREIHPVPDYAFQ